MPVPSVLEEVSVYPSCSKTVTGNYCSHCGEKLVSRGDLRLKTFLKEAFQEVTEVDSKLFRTLKFLFARPGFLTLEELRGKRNAYIKPFRLYLTLVVIHFVLFAAFPSGDIFNVERFPPIRFSPHLTKAIAEAEIAAKKPHALFIDSVSHRVRKNIEAFTYIVVFLAAAVLCFLYRSFDRYYVEHLYFVFHVFGFALARNVLVIPLVMLDLVPLTLFLVVSSQLCYTFLALRTVYPERPLRTLLKFLAMLVAVIVFFYIALHISVFLALRQP